MPRPIVRTLALSALLLAAPAAHAHGGDDAQPLPQQSRPPKAAPQPIPKAAPRGEASPAALLKLPPYMGIFGPAPLLQKTGFRSAPGRYIEYRLASAPQGTDVPTALRIQEVGPAGQGQRWIEMVVTTPGQEGSGVKLLTRGEGMGNVQRIIARPPSLPPMEFPLSSMTTDDLESFSKSGLGSGELKKVGRETVQVPLGRFTADHYTFTTAEESYEYWVAEDKSLPFSGIVKMNGPDGLALATKTGSDAVGQIPIPPRAQE